MFRFSKKKNIDENSFHQFDRVISYKIVQNMFAGTSYFGRINLDRLLIENIDRLLMVAFFLTVGRYA